MSVVGDHIDISQIGKGYNDEVITFKIQFIWGDRIEEDYTVSCNTGQYISDINEIITNINLNRRNWNSFYYHTIDKNGFVYIPLKDDDKVSKILDYDITYNKLFICPRTHNYCYKNIKSAKI